MSKFYYLGLAKFRSGSSTHTAIVRSEDGCYFHPGNIVEFHDGSNKVLAEVSKVAFVHEGSEEEAILKELAPKVYTAEKIYNLSWTKKEEEENDGN